MVYGDIYFRVSSVENESLYINPFVVHVRREGGGIQWTDEKSFILERTWKDATQMGQLLGTSLKAIQNFEQGWRKIPSHVEWQVLLLLAQKNAQEKERKPCWDIEKCPIETWQKCPAWEFQCGNLC